MKRYNHWFWNSRAMYWVTQQIAYLNTWIWHKQHSDRD